MKPAFSFLPLLAVVAVAGCCHTHTTHSLATATRVPIETAAGSYKRPGFYENLARTYCEELIVGFRSRDFFALPIEAEALPPGKDFPMASVHVTLRRIDPMGPFSSKDYRYTNIRVYMQSSGALWRLEYEPFRGYVTFMMNELHPTPKFFPPGAQSVSDKPKAAHEREALPNS